MFENLEKNLFKNLEKTILLKNLEKTILSGNLEKTILSENLENTWECKKDNFNLRI